MNSWEHLNQNIQLYKRELMGFTSVSEQLDAMRKLTGGASAISVGRAYADHQGQLKKEREKLQRALSPFDSITSHATDIQRLTGLSAAHWNETSGLAAAASSINASLNGFAQKIADEFSAGQALMNKKLGLTVSQALASSVLGKSTVADLSNYGITAAEKSLRLSLSSLPEQLQASFSLAGLAGTTSLEKAIAAVSGTIGSEYSAQFDTERRIRELVGGMSTFDLARTMAITQLQSVEGIARQLATLGLEPGEYLEDDDTQVHHGEVGAYSQNGLTQVSLEVFQQLLINLIASYIFALFINSAIPNPDVEAQSKKLARLESLIEKLPQAIEAQVETIIRRELLAKDSFFVVRERIARLRRAPDGASGLLTLVFPNQKLTLLEERGKWIRVEFYDYLAQTTHEGWVLKKYCARLVQHSDRKHHEGNLNNTFAQTRADMAAGRIVQESPESHLVHLDTMNAAP